MISVLESRGRRILSSRIPELHIETLSQNNSKNHQLLLGPEIEVFSGQHEQALSYVPCMDIFIDCDSDPG